MSRKDTTRTRGGRIPNPKRSKTDPLSPKIFSAVLESVFRCLDWKNKGIRVDGELLNYLRFADDIVVFADSAVNLENMIRELAKLQEKITYAFLMNGSSSLILYIVARYPEWYIKTLTLTQFLKFDMKGVLILNIELPPLSNSYTFRSYKIMPRNQNALAIVNCAFLIRLGKKNIIESASIVYGNIDPKFIHAKKTERYLVGKNIFTNENLQEALKVLNCELLPVHLPGEPSIHCRKKVGLGLFYKFVLNIAPAGKVHQWYASGGELFKRPVSSGTEDYHTNSSLFPLNQPVDKLEALIQASGEASYVNDLPPMPREVFGAFVLSEVHIGEVDTIDADEVLYDGKTTKAVQDARMQVMFNILFNTHS